MCYSNGEMIILLIKESFFDGFLGKIMVLIFKFKNIFNRVFFFEKKNSLFNMIVN